MKHLSDANKEIGCLTTQCSVAELRRWGREFLEPLLAIGQEENLSKEILAKEVDEILKFVLKKNQTALIRALDSVVDKKQQQYFVELLERRRTTEPLAYILGYQPFYQHCFVVNPAVLIPRPETELLVEQALSLFNRDLQSFLLVDIGTGSGAIVLSILRALAELYGEDYIQRGLSVASDLSAAALAVARSNAQRLGLLGQLSFVQGNLLSWLEAQDEAELCLFVANPPYVADGAKLPQSVSAFEPAIALRAGPQGLNIIKSLVTELAPRLKKGAQLLLEIGFGQNSALESLSLELGLGQVRWSKDLRGIERIAHFGGDSA